MTNDLNDCFWGVADNESYLDNKTFSALSKEDRDSARTYIREFRAEKSQLLPILQKVQSDYRYLPTELMEDISLYLNIPLAKIYGVVSFYDCFRFSKPGKYVVKICAGTACHVKGSSLLVSEWERILNIKAGATSQDGLVTLEKVACVGCCSLAPVLEVNGTYKKSVKSSGIKDIYRSLIEA